MSKKLVAFFSASGTTKKAAEQLHITQPTLSRQMAAFEEDLLVQRRISPEITTSTVIAWRRNIPYSQAVSKMIEEINAFVTCL